MKSLKNLVVLLVMLAMVVLGRTAVEAATLEVGYGNGCQYFRIQDAIDDAADGDEVLVHSGFYQENINFNGREIVIRSENGPSLTIIDGDGSGSVVTFNSGEGSGSVLDGFTITDGAAPYGGGINCENASSPRIENCIITENIAGDSGGGIGCWSYCSPAIINCTISSNSAGNDGGGIYLDGQSETVIERCIISGNAAYSGGGIYNDHSSPRIINCTISGNDASFGGGGIYCHYSSPMIVNCTISGNQGVYYGGGIYCYNSHLIVINSILWENMAWGTFDEVWLDGVNSSMDIDYSDFNPAYIDGSGSWSGSNNNINLDPLFVNQRPATEAPTSDGDYHLTKNSPCINTGTSTFEKVPSDDIDGDSRPQSGTCFAFPKEYDMGSDEYVGTLLIVTPIKHVMTGGVDDHRDDLVFP